MNNPSETISLPFGTHEFPYRSRLRTSGPVGVADLSTQGLSDLYLSEIVEGQIQEYFPRPTISGNRRPDLWERTWYLLRSKLWRRYQNGERLRIALTTEEEAEVVEQGIKRARWQAIGVVIIEELMQEAADLSLEEKSLQTLRNLHNLWEKSKGDTTIEIPYIHSGNLVSPSTFLCPNLSGGTVETGITYGCSEKDAIIIYNLLEGRGFITGIFGPPQISITPAGHLEIDRLERGVNAAIKQAFFIRRYDLDLDKFLRPVMAQVAQRTGCTVEPVWERPHNDRIDDRILRLIRESPVIVLDVSERFNVGLEAGYALALKKPIVAIRKKPDTWVPPPFDITTLNCFDYELDKPEELISAVSERILIGLSSTSSAH